MSIFFNTIVLGEAGGLRVAIKDTMNIAGQPTCAGTRALADAPAARENAAVVDAVLEAGWQIVGKTNLHELAFGVTGINDWAGTPINPQASDRVPGGSSSGSAAAVGAGLADIALGTDTGGSVRVPAACCGVFGLKPTFGRVSRQGVAPAVSTLDCVGPFAASMQHLEAAMAVICPGYAAKPLDGGKHRVGFVEVACDAAMRSSLVQALDSTDWQRTSLTLEAFEDAFHAGLTVINQENWLAFAHLTGRGLLGADVEQRLLAAGRTRDGDRELAEQVRAQFTAAVDRALEDFDVLVLPTLPALPPLLSEARNGQQLGNLTALVRPFNLSGHPAISVPVPYSEGDLKVGLQIVGRKGEDERVCAFAAHLEHAMAARRPSHNNNAGGDTHERP